MESFIPVVKFSPNTVEAQKLSFFRYQKESPLCVIVAVERDIYYVLRDDIVIALSGRDAGSMEGNFLCSSPVGSNDIQMSLVGAAGRVLIGSFNRRGVVRFIEGTLKEVPQGDESRFISFNIKDLK